MTSTPKSGPEESGPRPDRAAAVTRLRQKANALFNFAFNGLLAIHAKDLAVAADPARHGKRAAAPVAQRPRQAQDPVRVGLNQI
ncbi:hypothetical protein [Pseudooceanicola sp. 200-1SW]|uniref:hypothetical protein n=1 Tax=Pseudooceanicola sp. 200-1SW TaxID=3425949 RepID=UPI003D7F3729